MTEPFIIAENHGAFVGIYTPRLGWTAFEMFFRAIAEGDSVTCRVQTEDGLDLTVVYSHVTRAFRFGDWSAPWLPVAMRDEPS